MSDTGDGAWSVPPGSTGSPAPALLLHGLFGDRDNLRGLADRLFLRSQSRRPIARLDLPAHGGQPATAPLSLAAMSDALAERIERLLPAPAPFHLLGHSLGGKLAMILALHHPALSARLLSVSVLDIGPRAYPPHHRPLIDALLAVPLDTIASRRDADASLVPTVPQAAVRAFLLKGLTRHDQGWRWRFDLQAIAADYEAHLCAAVPLPPGSPPAVPAVFLAGGSSDYLRDSDAASLHPWLPSARCVRVEDAGHWLHAERPDEVADRVADAWQASEP